MKVIVNDTLELLGAITEEPGLASFGFLLVAGCIATFVAILT